jgi:hypothetical protein
MSAMPDIVEGAGDERIVLETKVIATTLLRGAGALVELRTFDGSLLRDERKLCWDAALALAARSDALSPEGIGAEVARFAGDAAAERVRRYAAGVLGVAEPIQALGEPGEAARVARRLAEVVTGAPPGLSPARLTMDDVRYPPAERFAVGSIIPLGKVTVFFGPTSVGKSAALAQIAAAFAGGEKSLWGLPVLHRGGPVLVYTTEDTLDDWKRKGAALRVSGGINVERVLERLYVVDKTEGLARLSEVVSVRTGSALESVSRRVGQPTEERDRIIEVIREIGALIVIVETASRLVEREENEDFSALQSALGHVARETGAGVVLSHHPTKAASKVNDSSIESARGGGALMGNARCALSLFPADMNSEPAKAFKGRFPNEDLVVLEHLKATSSTRRQPPMVLVRTDGTWGAVFRLPDEVTMTPDQEARNAERLETERQVELESLRRLYAAVEKYLPTRPRMSPSWLRDHHHAEIGVPKNGPDGVEALVRKAVDAGILRVGRRTAAGIFVVLGVDPRKPISASATQRATSGECVEARRDPSLPNSPEDSPAH